MVAPAPSSTRPPAIPGAPASCTPARLERLRARLAARYGMELDQAQALEFVTLLFNLQDLVAGELAGGAHRRLP